jgi:hypothetical protein
MRVCETEKSGYDLATLAQEEYPSRNLSSAKRKNVKCGYLIAPRLSLL